MATIKLVLKTILYQPLYNALIFLVWLIPGHNVGWAIVVLTVIIRIILLPSSLKAARAQIKLRNLQPEMQKLQEKYKDDKQKQSQALMQFYKENKVSPWGSCLPLLIQFPILIVLYYVFINGLNTDSFHLLYNFVPRPDSLQTVWLGLDLAQPDKWILPIIAGALQFIQGYMMTPPKPKSAATKQDPTAMAGMVSKQMLYIMPVFTVIIAMRLPAALPLYWAITTLFGIGQQWWAEKTVTKKEIIEERLAVDKEFGLKPDSELLGSGKIEKNKKEDISKTVKHGVEVTVRRKK